jgi:hypothetical protein
MPPGVSYAVYGSQHERFGASGVSRLVAVSALAYEPDRQV